LAAVGGGGWETGKVYMQETSKKNLGFPRFFSIEVPAARGIPCMISKRRHTAHAG
jgi:hypothetical protein